MFEERSSCYAMRLRHEAKIEEADFEALKRRGELVAVAYVHFIRASVWTYNARHIRSITQEPQVYDHEAGVHAHVNISLSTKLGHITVDVSDVSCPSPRYCTVVS